MVELELHALCQSIGIIQFGFLSVPNFPANDGSIGVGDIAGSFSFDVFRCQYWQDGVFHSLPLDPCSIGDCIVIRLERSVWSISCNGSIVKEGIRHGGQARIWFPAISMSPMAACIVNVARYVGGHPGGSILNWKDEYFSRIVRIGGALAGGDLEGVERLYTDILMIGKLALESEIPLMAHALQLLFSYPSYHDRDLVLGSSATIDLINQCTSSHVKFLIRLSSSLLLSGENENDLKFRKVFLTWMSKFITRGLVTVRFDF